MPASTGRQVIIHCIAYAVKFDYTLSHTTTGCGEQGFPSAQPY
jgi:hypothetical protein